MAVASSWTGCTRETAARSRAQTSLVYTQAQTRWFIVSGARWQSAQRSQSCSPRFFVLAVQASLMDCQPEEKLDFGRSGGLPQLCCTPQLHRTIKHSTICRGS
jgi:hypothetical protein